MTRRIRAFKRWMKSQGIDTSDALKITDSADDGISVRAHCVLRKGDLVATIPKSACLTIRTSGAWELIEGVGLAGQLGLSLALMYERSLGAGSPWHGYLQLLPEEECVPLVWSAQEVDTLLKGTELQRIVKEDKKLIYKDWKECIKPLTENMDLKLEPNDFGVNKYFAAKTLVASRAFEIDDYHGFGMVPLADLFNHKTGLENVHFTSVCSSNSDNEDNDDSAVTEEKQSEYGGDTSSSADDPENLEMIIVRDVEPGEEVFNTYGSMGNAALLHRYGFTEPENLFDIVNIDLDLVLQWCSSLFSSRYARARLSLWRQLSYSGCTSQNSQYFEITSDGEPQFELTVILYIMLLTEEAFHRLKDAVNQFRDRDDAMEIIMSSTSDKISTPRRPEEITEFFLTGNVCGALVHLADMRECLYGFDSLEDDLDRLKRCPVKQRRLYHSLVLRVCERRILQRLRAFASRKDLLVRKRLRRAKRTRKIF